MRRGRGRLPKPDRDDLELSNGWFAEYTEPLWRKHLLPLAGKVATYLEIGICEGRSMVWVLEHLRPELAIGIDPYIAPRSKFQPQYDEFKRRAYANLERWINAGTVQLHHHASFDFLRTQHQVVPDASVDLAYIDGAHFAWDVVQDTALVWPKVKRGGIVIFDDLQRTWLNGRPLVRFGVRAFMEAWDSRWTLYFWQGRQIALLKEK